MGSCGRDIDIDVGLDGRAGDAVDVTVGVMRSMC